MTQKLVNGKLIEMTPEEETQRGADDAVAAEAAARRQDLSDKYGYRENRANAPDGYRATMGDLAEDPAAPAQPDVAVLADQIDCFYEYFENQRESGAALPAALTDRLDKRAAIKARYPKPPDP